VVWEPWDLRNLRRNLVGCCFLKNVMSNPVDCATLLCFCRHAGWSSSYSGELLRVGVPGIRAEAGWILESFGLNRISGLLQLLNPVLLIGGVPSVLKTVYCHGIRYPLGWRELLNSD
jgi:hypothetical protein